MVDFCPLFDTKVLFLYVHAHTKLTPLCTRDDLACRMQQNETDLSKISNLPWPNSGRAKCYTCTLSWPTNGRANALPALLHAPAMAINAIYPWTHHL